MAALTSIFGNEINVAIQPRMADKQYAGFPGAKGVTGMDLGTRGRQIIITGRLRAANSNYDTARSELQSDLDELDEYVSGEDSDAADYTYRGDTYKDVVFDRIQLTPDGQGKVFHWTGSEVFCDFICYARQLI